MEQDRQPAPIREGEAPAEPRGGAKAHPTVRGQKPSHGRVGLSPPAVRQEPRPPVYGPKATMTRCERSDRSVIKDSWRPRRNAAAPGWILSPGMSCPIPYLLPNRMP